MDTAVESFIGFSVDILAHPEGRKLQAKPSTSSPAWNITPASKSVDKGDTLMVIISEHNASTIIDLMSAQLDYQNQLIAELKAQRPQETYVAAKPEPVNRKKEEIIGAAILSICKQARTAQFHYQVREFFCKAGLSAESVILLLAEYAGEKYPHPRTCDGTVRRSVQELEAAIGVKICG